MDYDDEEVGEEECDEPTIMSPNPTERILARRLRIQRRVEALQKQKEAYEDLVGEEVSTLIEEREKTPVELQVERSIELLEKLLIEGEEYVTNVRVATEARETDRREREGIGKGKLLQELSEEAAAAEATFNEIAGKWAGILTYNDPLHINEDIMSQKERCDDLIKSKDALIVTLRAKLRSAEINFAIDQQKQIEDVNSITRRIENQITVMRKSYRMELQVIEEVVLAERQLLLDVNNKKWEELYKRRDQEENSNADQRSEDYWSFVEEMDNLNRDFGELYRETTITLENDSDELQREFEKIKREAVMNSEKLDYNYQILKKREDENMIIRSQQKRRINKLQDVLNSLRKRNRDYEEQTKQQIAKLTEEVKKLTQNILDIEYKADHTAKVNNVRFNSIWEMNIERADHLFKKILDIDRIVHEQQLGQRWNSPSDKMPTKMDLTSYKTAVNIGRTQLFVEKKMEERPSNIGDKDSYHYKKVVWNVLRLVVDKTGFLIEDQLLTILEPYMEKDKTLIKVDNVFSALHVRKREDIDLLLEYFLPYTYCSVCSEVQDKVMDADDESEMRVHDMDPLIMDVTSLSSRTRLVNEALLAMLKEVPGLGDQPLGTVVECGPLDVTIFDGNLTGECKGPEIVDKEPEHDATSQDGERIPCQFGHPLIISPVFVLTALREFLEKYHIAEVGTMTMNTRLVQKRSTISRTLGDSDLEAFWTKYISLFPLERQKLWDSLLKGLKRYHEMLKARKTASEEVVNLRKQNEELRRVFANYIDKRDIPY